MIPEADTSLFSLQRLTEVRATKTPRMALNQPEGGPAVYKVGLWIWPFPMDMGGPLSTITQDSGSRR